MPAGDAGTEPASGVWSFGLFDPVLCGGGFFGDECAEARALASLKLRLGVLDLGAGEQPQANQWFTPRIVVGVHVGPSMYAFAGNDPVNGSDPLGLKRIELQPGAGDRRALALQAKYREAYALAKMLPETGRILQELEESDSYTLEVKYDPTYRSGLVITPTEFDAEGKTTRALLRVGSKFPSAPTEKHWYPFGYYLTKRKEVLVYTVAHEELGHFLTSATDPIYNAEKERFSDLMRQRSARLTEIKAKLLAAIDQSDVSERKKRKRRLRAELEASRLGDDDPVVRAGREADEDAHLYVEGFGDRAGRAAVLEFRQQEKAGESERRSRP